jgi:hypothetical protein
MVLSHVGWPGPGRNGAPPGSRVTPSAAPPSWLRCPEGGQARGVLRRAVGGDVPAGTAEDQVVAPLAIEDVVTLPTLEHVATIATEQAVRATPAIQLAVPGPSE